jgi:predicted permease
MRTLLEDLRYGLRMLRKNPGFTVVAVLTIALGIGANTALFSVVNGVLLNPLPYPQPDQLVTLHESKPNFDRGSISFPNFLDWQRENRTFSSMAVARGTGFNLTGLGDAEQVNGQLISGDFFRVLGVKTVIGQSFTSEEDQPGRAPVALISAAFWQRKFSSAPDVLEKSITLDGKDYAIGAVIPASFNLALPGFRGVDIYVPIVHWNNPLLLNRGAGLGIHGIGRLKPGVPIEQARADMDRVARNLTAAYPADDKGVGVALVPLKELMTGGVRPFLLALLTAVGFVLMIACVNVANLMLARSTTRAREFAVRAALGAGRGRVVRQVLTESVLLAGAGGILGTLFAAWGTQAALGLLPTALPRAEEVGLDARVLIFTMLVSLAAGILFGLAPALKTARHDLNTTLKEGGRGASVERHRTQSAFVVAEIALALVLLTGAGLMIRSLARLWNVDPGFNPRNVLTFGLSLSPSMTNASPDAIRSYLREFDNKLEGLPGVQVASLSWGAFPLTGDDERVFWIDGQPKPASQNDMNWTLEYIVEPDYLKTMGIMLQRGRFLSQRDNERAPLVVVVDDVFARQYFPRQDPIGKRIAFNDYSSPAEIVGVVGHVKQWGLDSDDTQPLRAQVYLSLMQLPDKIMVLVPGGMGAAVRSKDASPGVFDSIRRTSKQMSDQQIIYSAQTMDEVIAGSLAARRFSMIIFGAFAVLALVLASIGIFGVTSYLVGQRTREIAIRMALGAERPHILRLVLGPGGRLALAGVGVGLAAAFGLTRLMASLLYGVAPTDPMTFGAVALLLILVALAACYIPARRASKVDPLVALRWE